MPDSFFERAADRAWLALPSATQATTRLQSVLKRHRYRVLAESQDGVTHLYADKNRWALVGTLITHLSVVTLVIAAAWGGAFAWREDGITLAPGEVHQIRDPSTTLGTGFGLRFDRLEIDRYPSGMPSDYRGYLTVLDGGSEVLSRVVRVNNPLTYRDVAFYLWSYGPAVRVHATDASGQPLLLPAMPPKGVDRTEIVLTFGGEGDVRGFSVPTQDLIVRLTFEAAPSSAMPRGAFFVEAFRSGDARPFFADVIRPGESLQQAGVRFDFGFENYVVLAAVSDPSFNAVIAIVLVMWVGLALSFYFPYHRLWARITAAGEVHLAGLPERNRIGLEEEFASLVADFQHVLERSG
jgi:cytochrome c biogenesis protein